MPIRIVAIAILVVGCTADPVQGPPPLDDDPPDAPVCSGPGQSAGRGIWIGADEIRALRPDGDAWLNLKTAADSELAGGDLTRRDDHNVRVMAAALVAACLDDDRYRARVRDALDDLIRRPLSTRDGLAVNRRLGTYAISADLIGLPAFDAEADARFREWLELVRRTEFRSGGGGTLAGYHERRPNNYGSHAGFSRMAVALYLGDVAEFERAVIVLRAFLGEPRLHEGFEYGSDLSWQADERDPVGINPRGATKQGRVIDGVLPDDQRRCGGFDAQPWPCTTNYAWEGLQGVVAMAWLGRRQGHDAFEWEDRAILRAMQWLYERAHYPPEGDDTWQPHILNRVLGTELESPAVTTPGKNVGWTGWTHVRR